MQILEYILANYTWFLVGIVLILLAIVGYYADKTNFGQGNKTNSKEKENNETTIYDDVESVDAINNDENKYVMDNSNVLTENLVVENQNDNNINSIDNANYSSSNVEDNKETQGVELKIENNHKNAEVPNIELIPSELPSEEKEVKEEKQEDILKINEEKFNMFSEEFESLMPKKNIISTDLLSDIDDLELDKTQKIDLSGVPDLDDIELPKIMELTTEEEDIWKF